ncbi:hypothetical protein ACWET9_15340 [Streptomyces sp. NPDC004059]
MISGRRRDRPAGPAFGNVCADKGGELTEPGSPGPGGHHGGGYGDNGYGH